MELRARSWPVVGYQNGQAMLLRGLCKAVLGNLGTSRTVSGYDAKTLYSGKVEIMTP